MIWLCDRPVCATLILLACMAVTACATSHEGIEGEVAAPGMPAHISWTDLSFAGGSGHLTITTIDSASAGYTVTMCETAVVSAQCPESSPTRQGVLAAAIRDRLFFAPTSAAFRALRAEYRSTSSIRPPDLQTVTLTITASERSRQITWESAVAMPGALASYLCELQSARGDLISCFLPD